MISKKIFISTIVISLIGHIAILTLVGFFEVGRKATKDVSFTVSLEEPPIEPETNPAETRQVQPSKPAPQDTSNKAHQVQEETIVLNRNDPKYGDYLSRLWEKIERTWTYPDEAYRHDERGTSVVKFSITGKGGLVNPHIIQSSGYAILDHESLRAVQSVAPFEHLPTRYNLSCLHIVAKFKYGVID